MFMVKFKVRIFDLVRDDLVEEHRYGFINFSMLANLIAARKDDQCRIIIDLNH